MNGREKVVGAYEAKTKLSELLEMAAAGETITITRRNEPVAKLVPARGPDRASLERLFKEMDEISRVSPLNPPGKRRVSVKELIEEGRK
jgi:prevent-host-death family protein